MAANKRIAIVDFDFSDSDIEERMCTQAGIELSVHFGRCDASDMVKYAQGADAVISSYGDVTREALAALVPRLKVVSRTGTGVDNIDVDAATEMGVAVCNVPGYGTEVVSDHAIALALSCLRRINEQDADMRRGIWDYARTRPLGQVKGRRFGIVGMGAIGRATARKASGLGFEVVCASRSLEPGTVVDGAYPVLSFRELVKSCDVVSFHTALTPQTRHLLDEASIASMKPEAIVVNTSRGAVIDTVALARALSEGRLWGAGLDVFEDEPLAMDHPIAKAPNTVFTPHAAYWSEESGIELRTRACQAAIDVLLGVAPRDCLNSQVLRLQ